MSFVDSIPPVTAFTCADLRGRTAKAALGSAPSRVGRVGPHRLICYPPDLVCADRNGVPGRRNGVVYWAHESLKLIGARERQLRMAQRFARTGTVRP